MNHTPKPSYNPFATVVDGDPVELGELCEHVIAAGLEARASSSAESDITDRKKAEDALSEGRRCLDGIIKAANVGTWVWNVRTGEAVFNDRWAEIIGYTLEEISPASIETWRRFAHPDDLRASNAVLEKHFEGELDHYEFEARMRHKDGTWVWVLDRGRVASWTECGKPLLVLGTHTDITERKRAEEALRESDERFKLSMEATSDGLWDWDIRTDEAYFSPAYYRMLGYAPDDFPGRGGAWKDMVHPDDVGRVISVNAGCIEGRCEVFEVEYRMKARGGGWRWILGRGKCVARDGNGRATRMVGTHVDITERKRAEEVLRESETQYRSFIAHSSEGIYRIEIVPPARVDLAYQEIVEWIDRHAVIAEVNEALAEMYGLRRVDMVGRRATEFAPEYGKRAAMVLENSSLQVSQEETRDVDPDGNPVWLIESFHGEVHDGRLSRIWGVQRDITERKRAEVALRESEDRFRRLSDDTPVYVSAFDRDGTLTYVNRALCEMAGMSPEDFVGRNLYDILSLEGRASALERIGGLGPERPSETHEQSHVGADGVRRWQQWTNRAFFDGRGEVLRFLGVGVDITELKKAEEAAKANHLRLLSILDANPGPVYVADPESYDLLYINRALVEALGAPEGRKCYEHLQHRSTPCPFCTNDRILGANFGKTFSWEFQNEANGRYYQCLDRAITWPDGRVVRYEMAIDFTDRKLAVDEKAKLEGQLQQAQKMESVGRLAGGVAHDFNNMLGVILGHVELAMDQLDPEHPAHADLEEILKATQRSADLTRQLLAFARKQTVAPKVLDLNETVAGMLKMLKRLIGEDVRLKWLPAAGLWPVKVDPTQVDQVLANLCVNARDAIADVGRITIETGNATIDEDYCATHAGFTPGEYVRLTVSDDGCGMDRETLSHVFEPFFTTKGVGSGTGLGLATVYGAVRQNDGFINVYSEPGHGTAFSIYLPRHAGKADRGGAAAAVELAVRGRETILLVEDEPAILKMVTTMLERQGYKVIAACAPGEALRLAREHAGGIHLLMTDVVMPEMNGRDLAKNLLSLYPHVKRLFMSGYTADVIAHHDVLDEGVFFIRKPFSIKELASKVREAMDVV